MSPPNERPPRGRLVSATELDGREEQRASRLPREPTLPGLAPPAPGAVTPPHGTGDDVEDTGMRSADSLVLRLAEKARIEAELRRQIAEQAALLAQKPPQIESDDSVIAKAVGRLLVRRAGAMVAIALVAGAPGGYAAIKSVADPKPATAPVLDDVRQTVAAIQSAQAAQAARDKARSEDDTVRWRITMAFLCAQGLRARQLDCDALQRDVDFAAQPLNGKKPPTWKTGETWPASKP